MLLKTGRFVPVAAEDYTRTVAAALFNELGDSHRAVKTIGRWTGACERTATNWLNREVGPRGHHLVSLVANSDEVLDAILTMAARRHAVASVRLFALRDQAEHFVRLVDSDDRQDRRIR